MLSAKEDTDMKSNLTSPRIETTQFEGLHEPASTLSAPDADSQVGIICNLSTGEAFVESVRTPHVPVATAFGGGPLQMCRLHGSWDLDLMVADYAGALFRSIRFLPSKDSKNRPKKTWDDLTFRFGPRAFVYADANRIVGYAETPAKAEALVAEFATKYRKQAEELETGGTFNLIRTDDSRIGTREVVLPVETVLGTEAFRLHYGSAAFEWHEGYVKKLKERASGLSIFEGKPADGLV